MFFWGLQRPHSVFNPLGDVGLRTGPTGGLSADGSISPQRRKKEKEELWQCLLHMWHGLEQSLIDDAVDQCQTHLRACVPASGRHLEHTLWLSICFLCSWWTFSLYLLNFVSHHAWCRGSYSRLHHKSMKCGVSFSQGGISMLFRWGGHVFQVCVKNVLLLTAVQNYFYNRTCFLQTTYVLPRFYGSQYINCCTLLCNAFM